MTAKHIAAAIKATWSDGIMAARERGATLTTPIKGAFGAAEAICRAFEAIEGEHGPVAGRVYQAMVTLSLDKARGGRPPFLATPAIVAEYNAISGLTADRAMDRDDIRPVLHTLAIEGAVFNPRGLWMVTAFSDRLPGDGKATTLRGKAPAATAPKATPADRYAEIFGRPARATVATVATDWDAEATDEADEATDWEPRPAVTREATPAARSAASVAFGKATAPQISDEAITQVLLSLPPARLLALLERATAPTAPTATPAATTRKATRKRARGTVIKATTPTA